MIIKNFYLFNYINLFTTPAIFCDINNNYNPYNPISLVGSFCQGL